MKLGWRKFFDEEADKKKTPVISLNTLMAKVNAGQTLTPEEDRKIQEFLNHTPEEKTRFVPLRAIRL